MFTRRAIGMAVVSTLLGIIIGLACTWQKDVALTSVMARRHRPEEVPSASSEPPEIVDKPIAPGTAAVDATVDVPLPAVCSLRQLVNSTLCPDHDQDRWLKIKASATWSSNGGSARGDLLTPEDVAQAGINSPTWMCDKLPVNLSPWEASSLNPSDLAVAVFSGTSLLHSRANAMMDGWLNRLEKRYIFDRLAEATTPITTLRSRFKSWLAPHETRNAEVLAMFGLQQLFEDFPDAKWYIVIGDDTYVHIDYALRALQRFNASRALWLTYGGIYPGELLNLTNFTAEAWPKWGTRKFVWTSGAQSFYLSNPMVRDYVKHLATFMETFGAPRIGENVPDVLTGALLTMLGHKPQHIYESSACVDAYALDGISGGNDARTCMEWSCYHYVRPRRMLAIDQRAQHEKLDRLQNAGDAVGILRMFRAFLNEHYTTLRKKQTQVATLAHQAGVPFRVYDIPFSPDLDLGDEGGETNHTRLLYI